MPQLLPFAGLRPQPLVTGPLDGVICPPYDVINPAQREALLHRSPFNVVRVELPEGDYQGAAAALSQWRREGAFRTEGGPVLYGYRMSYATAEGGHRQTQGVIGALLLEPPGHGILPHEQTMPKAKSDRLELLRATHTNTSPIWCLCPVPGLNDAIGPVPTPSTALARARDDDGTLHEIWAIESPGASDDISDVIGASPLLVADGHHRYETALAFRSEQGAGKSRQGAGTGADAVLALVVELSDEHLTVRAIHRAVSGLPAGFDLLAALAPYFDLTVASSREAARLLAEMASAGALGVSTAKGTWLAAPRAGGPADGHELDSTRADSVLATLPPHDLMYEHDVDGAVRRARAGELDAVILCRPASVAQIAGTARGGQRMPPKTTFFWPKPATGLVFRELS
jgi:uncharacterized protein (DUF1015 family)